MTLAGSTIGMFSEKAATEAEIVDEIYATTGAVLMGKRMFDVRVEPWGDPPALWNARLRGDARVT